MLAALVGLSSWRPESGTERIDIVAFYVAVQLGYQGNVTESKMTSDNKAGSELRFLEGLEEED
jgi:hypothetical protein